MLQCLVYFCITQKERGVHFSGNSGVMIVNEDNLDPTYFHMHVYLYHAKTVKYDMALTVYHIPDVITY
jgi:hypothetical protein